MPAWKFTDQYLTAYPALQNSILSLLTFSSSTPLTPGTAALAFSGTLDVAATGAALRTLGILLNLTAIDVSGSVMEANNTLTVSLKSTNGAAFRAGVAGSIPLIGGSVTKAAWLDIETVVATTTDADDVPPTDNFDLGVTLAIGSATATLVAPVPMHEGLFSLTGTFTDVGVGLADLDFLMGSHPATGHAWFPTQELGPYAQRLTTLDLLTLTLTAHVALTPGFAVSLSSVTAHLGIPQLPLMGQQLYLDPLGVWITVADPTGRATATWGLEGTVALCNYSTPGPAGLAKPDFTFDFTMGFPTPPQNPNFSLSGTWENHSQQPVSLIMQDLLGPTTDVGIGKEITLNAFEFETQADGQTGTITDFSTALTLSTGFGLFANQLIAKEIALAVTYSGS